MIEAIIITLIYIVLLAIAVYLILWVIEIIGLPVPQKVIQLIWVAVALVAILIIVRVLLPGSLKLGAMLPLLA